MSQAALADAECAVLGLVWENAPLSGYRLLAIAAERGMAAWAGLSATSVYKGVKKLRAKGHVAAVRDARKTGRGPAGLSLSVTPRGRGALRRHVRASLARAREQSAAFKLALAFVDCLPPRLAVASLRGRVGWLRERLAGVRASRRSLRRAGAEPRAAALIFEYVGAALAHEAAATARLIDILQGAAP